MLNMLQELYPQYVDKAFVQQCVQVGYLSVIDYKSLTGEDYTG
ncbi:unnamed protein product [Fructobacillus evanidus]|uniref:XkdX family protein n=1 Tax=Fructobacillus evanidus TaxID=3064281 RepID=A0ABN9YZP5_9LACO|nr:unnamed protein product [Fructobacillus sp. LMG 32999]CAK1251367.1 unnamed protein product [Fructobacillus sp. LMG 32999]